MDHARFGSVTAHGVAEVRDSLEDLPPGWWAVVVTFEGTVTAVRFEEVCGGRADPADSPWTGLTGEWRTSMARDVYEEGVEEIRRRIAAGAVYQVNLCRVLSQPVPSWPDLGALADVLALGNPAPYAGVVDSRTAGVGVVCASPELYLRINGTTVTSGPIKGTATTADRLLAKDYSENVMIVDLVRNDLSHICEPGSVEVEALCALEEHPGLVHLTSYVTGRLRRNVTWTEILDATFPPGSVSGAPKSSALRTIGDLETEARSAYCGAVGWVDTRDPGRTRAELAVGIRSFFVRDGDAGLELCFGTGAGITWGSDPAREWAETELKASRLVGLASGPGTSSHVTAHDLGG
ncbi:MAG: chorismate-binding protein [Intrasporangiaceae bacterium]|nr:chorismate-binding protein [Intrasporangiaceae bacterium]